MQFTVNGGGTLTSFGNTADDSVTGVKGLQLTALKTGTTTITIDSDRSGIQKGITDLIDQYNKVQTFIGYAYRFFHQRGWQGHSRRSVWRV